MNELDLIRHQITIFSELATELLNSEALIKRQQQDYRQRGTRSHEAQKIEHAFFQVRLSHAISEEIHRHALQALRLKKISEDYLRLKEEKQAVRAQEEYIESMNVSNEKYKESREEVRRTIAQHIKETINILKEQIKKLDQLIKNITEKIEQLKVLRAQHIQNHVVPIIYDVQNRLLKKEIYFYYQGKEISLHNTFKKMFDSVVDNIQKSEIQSHDIESRVRSAPYKKGAIVQAFEESEKVELDDKTSSALDDQVCHELKEENLFASVNEAMRPCDELNEQIIIFETSERAAQKLRGACEQHTEELYEFLSNSRGAKQLDAISEELPVVEHVVSQIDQFLEGVELQFSSLSIINDSIKNEPEEEKNGKNNLPSF